MEKRLLAPDLYKYLLNLAAALEGKSESDAAQRVLHVSQFASGSTSELYGEALLLLPKILEAHAAKVSDSEKAQLRDVIAGIERELGRAGGG